MENSGSLNKEKNFISAVIYVKNNESTVNDFLRKIDEVFHKNFTTYEFVIINDASEDNSVSKIKSISETINGNVTVINLPYKHGIETAMLAGVEFAIGDFVYEFDSTIIDYNLELIMELYNTTLDGNDIVAASPSNSINFSSKIFYKYLNNISRLNMSLTTETFRIVSRRALNRVLRSKEKLRYRKALYHYSGFNSKTIFYEGINTGNRRSNLSVGEKFNLASDVLVSFSDIGTKLPLRISIIFATISLVTIIYTIYSYFTVENIQPGWTTTMMFISVSFTGLFFVLAVISKYINVLLYELQDKPRYIYKSVDRFSSK
ncbi:glycosyltransferase [Litchfieldia alkalitelluris]|uniref:glycosyltransferase n=1 Tax=Litchfieldia alkalitelluris TaxID=304268 RepID=UPI0009962252|nr:glycosyltransferase [Litchfieldia alkalitelluris]